jgi:arylsulfatase A-like enzyme
MRRLQNPIATGLAFFALAGAGCSDAPAPAARNALIVTIDTLRADRVSAFGASPVETPHLDRLAAQGAFFANAFADVPWTTPSMSSVMTGLYANRHGLKSPITNRLGLEQVTLAERLRSHGFATGAVIGSFPLDSIYQLDQGFEFYDDAFTTPIHIYPNHEFTRVPSVFSDDPDSQRLFVLSKSLNDGRRTDAEVSDVAIRWLRERGSGRFFLWVHYFGPHAKLDWRIPEARRELVHLAQYEPDVEVVDREVGRLLDTLDELGLAEQTLVVLHADHGESLGENGYVGHGLLLNEATLRIPLILRLPGRIAPGQRIEAQAENVDIFPSVLDALGLPIPQDLSGQSLLPRTRGAPARGLQQDDPDGRVTYIETYFPAHIAFATLVKLPGGEVGKQGVIRRGVRTARWKLVRSEPHELIDVGPGEQSTVPGPMRERLRTETLLDLEAPNGDAHDVSAQHPEVARRLRARLDAWIEQEAQASDAPRIELDEETRARLESLGYVR